MGEYVPDEDRDEVFKKLLAINDNKVGINKFMN